MNYSLRTNVTLACRLDDAWALFGQASNLQRITPPELQFEILTPLPIDMKAGARIEYRIRLFGIPFSWHTKITCWEPGVRFIDEQLSGPFRSWVHEHHFEALGETSTRIDDEVCYSLPLDPIGRLAHPLVRARLDRIFDFREQKVRELLSPTAPILDTRAPTNLRGNGGRS